MVAKLFAVPLVLVALAASAGEALPTATREAGVGSASAGASLPDPGARVDRRTTIAPPQRRPLPERYLERREPGAPSYWEREPLFTGPALSPTWPWR